MAVETGKHLPASLRVLQWNILADGLAQPSDFIRASQESLLWSSRRNQILAAMLAMDPDVMCLQELNHFDDFFMPELGMKEYTGLFHPKKSSPSQRFGCPPDGCAIFYKKSRLRVIGSEMFAYMGEDGSEQSQGAIMCHFRDVTSGGREFLVANTHLKAKSGSLNASIRKSQSVQLLQRLTEMRTNTKLPIILCGDFNSEPGQEVWDVLTQSFLTMRSVYAAKPCDCSESCQGQTFGDMEKICHKMQDRGVEGELPFTTWKFRPGGEKLATNDYVWWSCDSSELQPSRRQPLPSLALIGPNGLPSENFPSDHLQLVCDFQWIEHVVPSQTVQNRHSAQLPANCRIL